ncbi:L-sorbosone dehydrogenase [Niabella ginsenosidivorans]|uniref:L-sorbosone dehydrogenase n=1 Tax=Niabella ginsenosidivorans TaxID=1176587 RepID=A0A1A9I059_9BACT|nr:sorbosone dehydrogenase family protein [Niabella ginsenosidivorans]ANH80120.1 L-sorbosone dehydrogenase [Niabella ginsenosidivorans]
MKLMIYTLAGLFLSNCLYAQSAEESVVKTKIGSVALPAPNQAASKTKFSKVIGWPGDKTPVAPEGFKVNRFAEGMKSPRNIILTPDGDVLVALSNSQRTKKEVQQNERSGKAGSEVPGKSVNEILLLRDADKDGVAETRTLFLSGLNQPFGMLIRGNRFFVANTDGVWVYPYKRGDTVIRGEGKKIIDLPAGGYNNHWTRNLILDPVKNKLYVSVGSGSNAAEHGIGNEKRRANILELNPDGTGERIYGAGLRNPVGLAWAPGTHTLWTAVNERDNLGDDLVPDYITSVKPGGFYGWPWYYFGQHEDPRLAGQRPDLKNKVLIPDVPMGAHTASLGLLFYTGSQFPAKYRGGAFVGQHGSWNRSEFSGYRVAFVPFKNGQPAGPPEDFLTGFVVDKESRNVYGRPVMPLQLPDGSLLVTDDVSGIIWRVSAR